MAPPVRLVCFDLGRVLVSIANGWADACRRAAIAVPPELGVPEVSERLHALLVPLELGLIDIDAHTREVAECLRLDPASVRRVIAKWLVGPYPGATALLDDIALAGVKSACLSNTNGYHWELMLDPKGDYHEIFSRLDHHFASHLIGAMKPDAETYLHVESLTGVGAGAVVFFDDLSANVEAARARGWRAYRVEPGDPIPQMRRWLVAEGVLPS